MIGAGRWRLARAEVFVLAYVLVWMFGLAVAGPRSGLATDVVNLGFFAISVITAAAQWEAARAARDRRTRQAWRLLSLSSLLILVSGLGWTYWEAVFGVAQPQWLYRALEFLYVPAALGGFLSFPPDPAFSWRNSRARLDGALFAIGGAALSWHFALGPIAELGGITAVYGETTELALALAAVFALVRVRDEGTRAAISLALAGHLFYVLTGYYFSLETDAYLPGDWVDSLWFAAWVLRWMAARRAIRAPAEPARADAGYRGSHAPALFVAGAYTLLVLSLQTDGGRNVFILAVAAAAMTALLMLRQHLNLQENETLASEAAKQAAVFRSIVASATDLVLLVRPDLTVAYASPSVLRLVGRTEGAPFTDFLHPVDQQGVIAWLWERSPALVPGSYRCRVRDHAGCWREIEFRAQDRRGVSTMEGFVLNGRDVTQEVALERKLGHARKLAVLSAMAGRIAHAFNNALAAMQLHAEELTRDLPAGAHAAEDARAIGAAAERGAGITRQLLGFSGRHVIRPERFRPLDVVDALRPTFAQMLQPDRWLEVESVVGEATVVVDRAQFEQVLVNLVANARDALPAGGRVLIRIDRGESIGGEAPPVHVSVTDAGTGIPAEALPRVFEPFFTTKALGSGTGLGLAMVASIIQRAGGTVDVASQVGEGTTVTLSLPAIARRHTPLAIVRAIDLTDAAPVASRRLLLVDDDALVRRASARMLRRAGFTVVEAEDGTRALEIAADPTIALDLLLTDLMMPGLSGREVIERFRPIRSHVPIVCMTGFASQRDEDGVIALEVHAIVAKPFTSKVLLHAVESAIATGTARN